MTSSHATVYCTLPNQKLSLLIQIFRDISLFVGNQEDWILWNFEREALGEGLVWRETLESDCAWGRQCRHTQLRRQKESCIMYLSQIFVKITKCVNEQILYFLKLQNIFCSTNTAWCRHDGVANRHTLLLQRQKKASQEILFIYIHRFDGVWF